MRLLAEPQVCSSSGHIGCGSRFCILDSENAYEALSGPEAELFKRFLRWNRAEHGLTFPQAGEDIVESLAILYCGLGVDFTKKKEVVEMLRSLPSLTKGGQIVYNSIVKFFLWISSNCSKYVGCEDKFAAYLDERYALYSKQVEKYIAADKAAVVDTTERGLASLDHLISSGVLLAEDYKRIEQTVLQTLVLKIVNTLMQLKAKALAIKITEAKKRPTPFCCALTGPPGSGKTVLSRIIATTVVKDKLNGDDVALQRFNEKPTDIVTGKQIGRAHV